MIYEPIGLFSKIAYNIPELSVTIHSFEEICYVICEKLYDIDEFLMKDELIFYVRDYLALVELSERLTDAKPDLVKYVKTLLSYRNYLPEEECEAICQRLKDGSDAKEYVRLMARADFLFENGKYRNAILMYEHVRELMDEDSEKESLTYRELMGKLGKLYSLYYMFEEAAECFDISGDQKKAFFCRKLSMSRVEYVDMLLKEHPDESLAKQIDEMTKEPAEIAALKISLKETRSYGRDLAVERLSSRLKAEYRRMS